MSKIIDAWKRLSLMIRIVIGLVTGAILGLVFPNATGISLLGEVFTGALKGIAPVLVAVLVFSSLVNAKGGIGARFKTVITLYLATTFLAAFIAVVVSFLFPLTVTLPEALASTTKSAPNAISEVVRNILLSVIENPVKGVADGNFIGILFWSILFGLTMKKYASEPVKDVVAKVAQAVNQIVHIIINFAPFGVLGLVFASVSNNGISIFTEYGRLLVLLIGTMLFAALIINPLVVFLLLRRNPYPLLLKCLKESAITAFFTRSSAANIPANMALCESLGLDKDMYSVSISLGATINMDGAAVVITIMSLVCAKTLGIEVSFPMALVVSIMGTLGACGCSGVAGGSLLLIPLACSALGIPAEASMQMVSVGFIINVIQDSFETALNSSGDVFLTAAAEFYDWKKQGRELPL